MKRINKYLILFLVLLSTFSCDNFQKAKNKENDCLTSDCKNWKEVVVNISGSIDIMDSPKLYIKEIDKNKLLSIQSRINKFDRGYYFYFNITPYQRIEMPKKIKIKISTDDESIILEGTETSGKDNFSLIKYYSYIRIVDKKKIDFVINKLTRKIEFINPNNNQTLFYVLPSFSESIEFQKMLCCAKKLKDNVVKQE